MKHTIRYCAIRNSQATVPLPRLSQYVPPNSNLIWFQRIRRRKREKAGEHFPVPVHIISWQKQLILVLVCLMFGVQVLYISAILKATDEKSKDPESDLYPGPDTDLDPYP
jgi:hypothetical protein